VSEFLRNRCQVFPAHHDLLVIVWISGINLLYTAFFCLIERNHDVFIVAAKTRQWNRERVLEYSLDKHVMSHKKAPFAEARLLVTCRLFILLNHPSTKFGEVVDHSSIAWSLGRSTLTLPPSVEVTQNTGM